MDPTLEEKQSDQPQQKRSSEGTISQGINRINNFARRGFPNPLGKVGSRVTVQAGLGIFRAFLAGPGLPIAITLGLVLLFTVIIIMGFGGAPALETTTPTITPTQIEIPTLTPVP